MNKHRKAKQYPWVDAPEAVDEMFNELIRTACDETHHVEIRCVPITDGVWRDEDRDFVDAAGETFDASIMGKIAVDEPLVGTIEDCYDDRSLMFCIAGGECIALDRKRIVAMRRVAGPVKLNFSYDNYGSIDFEITADGTAIVDDDATQVISRKDLRKLYDAIGEALGL